MRIPVLTCLTAANTLFLLYMIAWRIWTSMLPDSQQDRLSVLLALLLVFFVGNLSALIYSFRNRL